MLAALPSEYQRTTGMAKLCLNMIVKDEAHIIAATLKNIYEHFPIDYWVILDTGSTDETKKIIQDTFNDLSVAGEIIAAEWVNFSHNRNIALKHCQGKSDYILFFDADDQVVGSPNTPNLTEDVYLLKMKSENLQTNYLRKLIIKNNLDFFWRGVVHEFIDTGKNNSVTLEGDYYVVSRRKGARSQDPEKYKKDALLLEDALTSGQDIDLHPRYEFYCANSWRDYGDDDKALKWYLKRTQSSGWSEEKYMAYLNAALILERRGDFEKSTYLLLCGHDLIPERAECLYHATRILRGQEKFNTAHLLSKKLIEIKVPKGNRLFLRHLIYEYWSAYEYLYLMGRAGEDPRGADIYHEFMSSKIPDSYKKSIESICKT